MNKKVIDIISTLSTSVPTVKVQSILVNFGSKNPEEMHVKCYHFVYLVNFTR